VEKSMDEKIDSFLEQTAKDYNVDYETVMMLNAKPGNLYILLEEYIKQLKQ